MARTETNNAKRELMGRTCIEVLARGWTAAELAAYMNVTASTINAWRRAESMGTNAQRADLANLKSRIAEAPHIMEQIAAKEREIAATRAIIEGWASKFGQHPQPDAYVRQQERRIERMTERIRVLHELVCCAEFATGSGQHDGECPNDTESEDF